MLVAAAHGCVRRRCFGNKGQRIVPAGGWALLWTRSVKPVEQEEAVDGAGRWVSGAGK